MLARNLIQGKVYQFKVPYLLSTTSPKVVSALAEVQVYTILRIRICLAGPGPKGFQSTEVEVKFDLAELGHSGIDGWCLEYEGFPLRRNIKDSSVAESQVNLECMVDPWTPHSKYSPHSADSINVCHTSGSMSQNY